jgi:hypothetical protein
LRSISLLILFGIRGNCLRESVLVPIYKEGDTADCSTYRGISLLLTTYKVLTSILLSRITPDAEESRGIIAVDFDIGGQQVLIYSAYLWYLWT